jgi:rare lipoprotein A
MRRSSLPPVLLLALLLSACAPKVVKPPPAPAETSTTPAPRESGSAIRRARPDQPGEYTSGGLYKPGVADSGPAIPPDISALPEPVPQEEPRARYGNRSPYTVLGRSYHVMDSARGYKERGIASWYGEKFHGRATSSLEPYDMYAFTAAHKSLPLPTYVRVTNIENGRSVVVRVNDRGPFHGARIIDLSYAAAIKLGMHIKGTASVEVHALTPGEAEPALASQPPQRSDHRPRVPSAGARVVTRPAPARAAPLPATPARVATTGSASQTWLQVASFGNKDNAKRLVERLEQADVDDVDIQRARVRGNKVWRVRIGPLQGRDIAERLAAQVRALGLGSPTVIAE